MVSCCHASFDSQLISNVHFIAFYSWPMQHVSKVPPCPRRLRVCLHHWPISPTMRKWWRRQVSPLIRTPPPRPSCYILPTCQNNVACVTLAFSINIFDNSYGCVYQHQVSVSVSVFCYVTKRSLIAALLFPANVFIYFCFSNYIIAALFSASCIFCKEFSMIRYFDPCLYVCADKNCTHLYVTGRRGEDWQGQRRGCRSVCQISHF